MTSDHRPRIESSLYSSILSKFGSIDNALKFALVSDSPSLAPAWRRQKSADRPLNLSEITDALADIDLNTDGIETKLDSIITHLDNIYSVNNMLDKLSKLDKLDSFTFDGDNLQITTPTGINVEVDLGSIGGSVIDGIANLGSGAISGASALVVGLAGITGGLLGSLANRGFVGLTDGTTDYTSQLAYLDDIDSYLSEIQGVNPNTANLYDLEQELIAIKGHVDGIEGYVDNIESKLDDIKTDLTHIKYKPKRIDAKVSNQTTSTWTVYNAVVSSTKDVEITGITFYINDGSAITGQYMIRFYKSADTQYIFHKTGNMPTNYGVANAGDHFHVSVMIPANETLTIYWNHSNGNLDTINISIHYRELNSDPS